MSYPELTPTQTTSPIILPETGSYDNASLPENYPQGVYVRQTKQDGSTNDFYDPMFISGAVEQVNFTYRKLAGDIVDIELTEENIYASYEEATIEYSKIINMHQAVNTLGQSLGNSTGSFDQRGQLSGSDVPSDLATRLPKFDFGYSRQIGDAVSTELGIGGTQTIYSASFDTISGVQDYDLQNIISSSAVNDDTLDFYNKVGDKRIFIRKVFFKTPHAMWRFYGYYGGLNAVGNLSTYGMYADDSTFQIVPVWQNKMQAMAYEDAIYTRNSHYSYEIKNNKLRIFPIPSSYYPSKVWIQFTVQQDVWENDEDSSGKENVFGVNNLNNIPFTHLPFKSINSIGKQWIRNYALAISKGMLAHARGKLDKIPVLGDNIVLNASELYTQSKEEMEALKTELNELLDKLTYPKMLESDSEMVESAKKMFEKVPFYLYVG